ncbi:MAG TPA: GNAT family N-acetyltransferase [Polyangiales bacterium]|nr:GNAT family N-acetyltransferase [Polyangiales bacterium]
MTDERAGREWFALAHKNLVEFARVGALWSRRGEVAVHDDLQLVASGTRFPAGMFNSALALCEAPDEARARAWLVRAARFFSERARGFSVYIRGELDGALEQACIASGMVLGGSTPAMLLAAKVAEPELPPGTRIEQAPDARTIADLAQVAGAGFALHGMPEVVSHKLFADPERVLSPELSYYVAYVDDRPASTAICMLSHGIAGLYWIATHPELQRRGLGAAITRRASNEAFDRGAAAVILQASTHGEPVYRRLGYQSISNYKWYFITADQAARLI